LPDGNVGGYLQPPPLLLTDLKSLSAFSNPSAFPNADGRAPISVIRVRVAGVHGDDALSRERIRVVAQEIEQATHLQVDVTAGSSPSSVRVDLPASAHTPALQLNERWVRKGVAEAILSALDKQSAVLFVLILVVGAIFVYNAAAAGVQSRRVQFGVLRSLGWGDRALFSLVLGEQSVIGIAAGLLGTVIAIPVSSAAGFHAGAAHALLAIPAAFLLALVAAFIPSVRAARTSPMEALRQPVPRAGASWHVRSVAQLALINITRAPIRSLLAATSLAVGVGALTLLAAITAVFHNTLTGSLLGSAISLQVRGSDYAAVIVIVTLAAVGIADVLYLSVRERAAELATLQAIGWSERTLKRLIISEALWLGLTGSLSGAALGVVAASTFAGALPHQLILVAAIATVGGLVVAGLAALAPTVAINRMAPVPILAAE
jgi:ABC-type antimicrobial peptide transport system permease subunit